MTEITEGALTFSFPNGCEVSKYDDWTFYQKRFQSVAGRSKAADFLCLADGVAWLIEVVAWLIEVKDYRQRQGPLPSDLVDKVAIKIRDTLSGLATAYANADGDEKGFARRAIETGAWRVVLHLEQPDEDTRLRQKAINPADVRLKLRQSLKAVDPHLVVMDMGTQANVPWNVQWAQVAQRNK